MTDEEKRDVVEFQSRQAAQCCNAWAKQYPLLIGHCDHNYFAFCKEKSCSDVTVDDWRAQAIKSLNLQDLYK